MPLDFTAIDFETANNFPASACAVGLVKIRDGEQVDFLEMLIQPPWPNDWFSAANIRVHGITPDMLQDAKALPDALAQIVEFIESDVLIAHNAAFDMGVLGASAKQVAFELPAISYSCSVQIARKTYHLDSYRLNEVAYAIGHENFNHHNALADSDACAKIVIHAAKRHGANSMAELLASTSLRLQSLALA
jgi:DNA polymerase III subunit epsilon